MFRIINPFCKRPRKKEMNRNPLACPPPPEDHWDIRVMIRYVSKDVELVVFAPIVPKGTDVTECIIGAILEMSARNPIENCEVVKMSKVTKGE